MSVGAIILAAGGARRYGAPKQLARLDGRTLIEHVAGAVARVPAIDETVVVLGANADAITAAADLGAARVVRCAGWEEGMAASLRAGAAALAPDTDCALVVLGDQPRITPAVLRLVLEDAQRGGADAVRAAYAGVPGHPVALRRPLLRRVAELHGDVGARELLATAEVRLVEAGHLGDPTDVDTPQDLEALEAIKR